MDEYIEKFKEIVYQSLKVPRLKVQDDNDSDKIVNQHMKDLIILNDKYINIMLKIIQKGEL